MPGSWVGHHILGLHFAVVILAVGVAGFLILWGARELVVAIIREVYEQERKRNHGGGAP
jgi:hypothetical protein